MLILVIAVSRAYSVYGHILIVARCFALMYLLGYIGACMSRDGPDSARGAQVQDVGEGDVTPSCWTGFVGVVLYLFLNLRLGVACILLGILVRVLEFLVYLISTCACMFFL